jgi:hypothetical protein
MKADLRAYTEEYGSLPTDMCDTACCSQRHLFAVYFKVLNNSDAVIFTVLVLAYLSL